MADTESRKVKQTIVILSSFITPVIQEEQPDTRIFVFNSMTELTSYLEKTPIRAEKLYVSTEIFGHAVNSSIQLLLEKLRSPFFHIDNVIILTRYEDEVKTSLHYIIEEEGLTNWTVDYGKFTTDYISNYILGTLKQDEAVQTKKAVYVQRADAYVKQRRDAELSGEFQSIEQEYSTIAPTGFSTDYELEEGTRDCKIVDIVASTSSMERDAFAIVAAQYLSFSGKVVILEYDYDYLQLTSLINSSDIECLKIYIEDLYKNPDEILAKIADTSIQLIAIVSNKRKEYDYDFLLNHIYFTIGSFIDYIVRLKTYSTIIPAKDYIGVIPADVVSMLRETQEIPENYKEYATFVGICINTMEDVAILDSKGFSAIVADVLGYEALDIPIFRLKSLQLGGESHDLRMLLSRK